MPVSRLIRDTISPVFPLVSRQSWGDFGEKLSETR